MIYSLLKMFIIYCVCILFGNQLNFVKSEIGEGTMDISDLHKCFKVTTCLDEEFVVLKQCYAMLGEEELQKAITIIKEAIERVNLKMESQTVDGMRDEYCDFTDEQKEACFNEGMDTILDMYTSYCMSHRTKKQCDRLENFMDCSFTIMDRYAEEGKCGSSEAAEK
ncbi:unnamed protein product [Larinioides sclopetarius]|uniref:DUF19 domain-containing protein n=1 Tax=Larinioides sclopetarius TaxID=280406 RepID=A0AAV1ZWC4_9ARAC